MDKTNCAKDALNGQHSLKRADVQTEVRMLNHLAKCS